MSYYSAASDRWIVPVFCSRTRNWWPAVEGDCFCGVYQGMQWREVPPNWSNPDPTYPVVVLRDENNAEWEVTCSTTLKMALEDGGIKEGVRIMIVFEGRLPFKKRTQPTFSVQLVEDQESILTVEFQAEEVEDEYQYGW